MFVTNPSGWIGPTGCYCMPQPVQGVCPGCGRCHTCGQYRPNVVPSAGWPYYPWGTGSVSYPITSGGTFSPSSTVTFPGNFLAQTSDNVQWTVSQPNSNTLTSESDAERA